MEDFFKNIAYKKGIPKPGKLLLSDPFLEDLIFKRAVILLTEHNDKGSVGFILNKPVKLSINEVVPNFPKFDALIFYGGPVEPNSLFYIHQYPNLNQSKEIIPNVFWGGDFEQLKALIEDGIISPQKIRFFAGYAGWETNQLEDEINKKSWIVTKKTNPTTIMDANTTNLWSNILKEMGNKFEIMSNFPEDPNLN